MSSESQRAKKTKKKQTTLSLEWNSSACCIPSFCLFLFISQFSLENIRKEELVLFMTSSVSLMKVSYVYPQPGVFRQVICVVKWLNLSLRLCAAGWFPFVETKSHRLLPEVLSFWVFCARCTKVNCWISQTAKPLSQASKKNKTNKKKNNNNNHWFRLNQTSTQKWYYLMVMKTNKCKFLGFFF